MARKGYIQCVKRLCYTAVRMDADENDSKKDIVLGALQEVMVRGEEMPWTTPPIGPRTILPYLEPKEIPASQLRGAQALTTAPEGEDEEGPELQIPVDGLPLTPEQAAQLGASDGGEGAEDEDDQDEDDEDMVASFVAYLDFEDSLDQRRLAGQVVTEEEYRQARDMRTELRSAYLGDEEDGAGENLDAEVEVEPGPSDEHTIVEVEE